MIDLFSFSICRFVDLQVMDLIFSSFTYMFNVFKVSSPSSKGYYFLKAKKMAAPPFEGPVPRRDEISFEEPTLLPTRNNRVLLAWRARVYNFGHELISKGQLLFGCSKKNCKGRVRMRKRWPLSASDVIKTSAISHSSHCLPSERDIYLRRAAVR